MIVYVIGLLGRIIYQNCYPTLLLVVVDELFSVISECQRLYPDSDLSSNEEEEGEGQEEGNFYTSPEGLQELSAEGESVLRHLENILHINDDENPQENGRYRQ